MKTPVIISAVMMLSCSIYLLGATRYDGDGKYSARLEEIRWQINRARYAPEREADRLYMTNTSTGGHPDYDACEDVDAPNDFGTTSTQWSAWTVWMQPLAPNALISIASSNHAKDMMESDRMWHDSPSTNYYAYMSNCIYREKLAGYTNEVMGFYENISYRQANCWWSIYDPSKYPSEAESATDCHKGFFTDYGIADRGHRKSILNSDAREIGLGHARTNWYQYAAGWHQFYTEDWTAYDFGKRWSIHFFTDTIFYDSNSNGVYNQGEGLSNIEVRIWNGTNENDWYDMSETNGSFTIPVTNMPDGNEITVQLVNKRGSNVTITVPIGFYTVGELLLTNNESFNYGTYIQSIGPTNRDFRCVKPTTSLAMTQDTSNVYISYESLKKVDYRIYYSDILTNSAWATQEIFTASNAVVNRTYPMSYTQRFYKVVLMKD